MRWGWKVGEGRWSVRGKEAAAGRAGWSGWSSGQRRARLDGRRGGQCHGSKQSRLRRGRRKMQRGSEGGHLEESGCAAGTERPKDSERTKDCRGRGVRCRRSEGSGKGRARRSETRALEEELRETRPLTGCCAELLPVWCVCGLELQLPRPVTQKADSAG